MDEPKCIGKRDKVAPHTYRQGRNDWPTGSKRILELDNALFSFTLRPPDSVVFRAPDFHGSGVITFPNFFSHLSHTISVQIDLLQTKLDSFNLLRGQYYCFLLLPLFYGTFTLSMKCQKRMRWRWCLVDSFIFDHVPLNRCSEVQRKVVSSSFTSE